MRNFPVAPALAALLLAFASSPGPVRAAATQPSDAQLDAILADIDKKTDQYAKFRSLLSDQDQAKRMAAFDAMTNSGIVSLQEMALDLAFKSGDSALQSAALQALLTKTKALNFRLEPSKELSEQTKQTIANHGGGFAIDIDRWDARTASFVQVDDTYKESGSGQGQLSGLSLHYTSYHCSLSVVLDETARNMLGELTCTGFTESVKVALPLR